MLKSQLSTKSKSPEGTRLLHVGTSIYFFIVSDERTLEAIFLK